MRNDLDHNKREFYIRIAKLYYLEGLSQQEISDQVGVSRSHVSKILKACLDLKIVEIRVDDTTSFGLKLQKDLKECFNLDNVVVIPSDNNDEKSKINLGRAGANLFKTLLKPGNKIGLTRGRTLFHLVDQLSVTKAYMDLEVIQLVGGSGAVDLDTDGLELARNLAIKLNAKCNVLQAPLIVMNKELKDMLIRDPSVYRMLQMANDADIALLGVGTNFIEDSSYYKSGFVTKEESEALVQMGAIGEICGTEIDINGNIIKTEISERIIGIEAEVLRKIPKRICFAGGAHKAEAILGAIRGGFINSLVTDENAAMRILSLYTRNT